MFIANVSWRKRAFFLSHLMEIISVCNTMTLKGADLSSVWSCLYVQTRKVRLRDVWNVVVFFFQKNYSFFMSNEKKQFKYFLFEFVCGQIASKCSVFICVSRVQQEHFYPKTCVRTEKLIFIENENNNKKVTSAKCKQ